MLFSFYSFFSCVTIFFTLYSCWIFKILINFDLFKLILILFTKYYCRFFFFLIIFYALELIIWISSAFLLFLNTTRVMRSKALLILRHLIHYWHLSNQAAFHKAHSKDTKEPMSTKQACWKNCSEREIFPDGKTSHDLRVSGRE